MRTLSKGILILGIAAFGAAVAVAISSFHNHANAAQSPAQELKKISAPSWPADQAISWSFPVPAGLDGQHGLSLRVRRKQLPKPATGESVAIDSQSVAMSATESQNEITVGFVSFPGGTSPGTGTATVQLLDLETLGAVSTHPGQNLRMIASMSLGGARCHSSSADNILPAGSFSGSSWQQAGGWKNNELYVMSFYVLGDKSLYKYDVLLQIRSLPSGH